MLGGAVAFKYRIHDPRIGRFLSIDPLAPDYPHNSPYAFSENDVIASVELEGLEKITHMMKFEMNLSGSKLYVLTSNEMTREFGSLRKVHFQFTVAGEPDAGGWNDKLFTANSRMTMHGRDKAGSKLGDFYGVHTVTEDDMAQLFAHGMNIMESYGSIDDALLAESGTARELDYKWKAYEILELDEDMLLEIDGVTYNPNEAGNFIWGAVNEYADDVTDMDALFDPSAGANIKTLQTQYRMDEQWEQKAVDDGENYGIEKAKDKDFVQKVKDKQ
jgi:hypothetical protein